MGWCRSVDGHPNATSFQLYSENSPQALEDMKTNDVIAVEKSLESKAWAQLWTLRITVSLRTRVGCATGGHKGL